MTIPDPSCNDLNDYLDTKVMGNEGLVINSDRERDYSHISDPVVLKLLKGKYFNTVKQGIGINNHSRIDEQDDEGAKITVKEGAVPYRCLSVRYTPFHWKQKALKIVKKYAC